MNPVPCKRGLGQGWQGPQGWQRPSTKLKVPGLRRNLVNLCPREALHSLIEGAHAPSREVYIYLFVKYIYYPRLTNITA